MSTAQSGARFYDEHKHDRGWAGVVVRRTRRLGRLIVLEIGAADPALLIFLRALDKAPLRVQQAGTDGVTYRFVWASGYDNGPTVRIQGILQDA